MQNPNILSHTKPPLPLFSSSRKGRRQTPVSSPSRTSVGRTNPYMGVLGSMGGQAVFGCLTPICGGSWWHIKMNQLLQFHFNISASCRGVYAVIFGHMTAICGGVSLFSLSFDGIWCEKIRLIPISLTMVHYEANLD